MDAGADWEKNEYVGKEINYEIQTKTHLNCLPSDSHINFSNVYKINSSVPFVHAYLNLQIEGFKTRFLSLTNSNPSLLDRKPANFLALKADKSTQSF